LTRSKFDLEREEAQLNEANSSKSNIVQTIDSHLLLNRLSVDRSREKRSLQHDHESVSVRYQNKSHSSLIRLVSDASTKADSLVDDSDESHRSSTSQNALIIA
jgi:hypothetical protein